jgi:NAD(P)-dependent dehydrogenase (short-subunit alcohol dehydrogenase family)|tara:strand:+ start:423 stop:1019 length:597 start_codon:yes stop_codon:yes gene_type:complete
MKKILITGSRNYGLCEAICNLFDTLPNIEYETASRSNGYNLDNSDGYSKLANYYIDGDFDIFINNSALWKFHQVMIAESVFNAMEEADRKGQIINIGSTADTGVKGRTWRYPTEKKALKAYNRDLTYMAMGGSNIKTTLISPGSLTTSSVMKKHPDRKLIDVEYIAELVVWTINQPEYINVNELSIDPIQHGTYARGE